MDLTLMDLQGNVIMDGLQSDIYWREDGYPGQSMTGSHYYYTVAFRESRFTPAGIAYICRDGKYGIIDETGNLLFDFSLDMWEPCKGDLGKQGYVIADIDNSKIVFDPYGNIYADFRQANPAQYESFVVEPPEYNTAIVKNHLGEYGVVDAAGNILVPIKYQSVRRTQEGIYNVFISTTKEGLYNVETKSVDVWQGEAPQSFTTLEKNNIKSTLVTYEPECKQYFNEDFELVCQYIDPYFYDAQGNIIEGVIKYLDAPLIDGINVYVTARHAFYDTRSLVAINEIPEPQAADGGRYICMMLDNPLINVDGNVSTIVENNYFFKLPLENDRTLVPMRVIFEALGAQVEWDGETQTVTATKDGKTMRLQIDKNELYIGDEMVRLDTPPRLIEGNTLVPLRAVSESFGATVLWDDDTRLITITWA